MISRKHFRACLTVFLCATLCNFSTNISAETAEEYHEKGMEEYNAISYGQALSIFRKSAEMGYAPSQAMLGTLLDASEDNEEAREWYQRAVDQGNEEAHLGLARMMSIGDGGEVDFPGAVELYKAAAENGSLKAMRILESNFRNGGLGLEADPERANYWLEQHTAKGDQ